MFVDDGSGLVLTLILRSVVPFQSVIIEHVCRPRNGWVFFVKDAAIEIMWVIFMFGHGGG